MMAKQSEYGPATEPAAPQVDDRRLARDRDAPHEDRRSGSSREFTNRDWEVANAPTDPERRRALREKWNQTFLPNLPKKEGWHRCWVSTNHPTDTPARRLGLGYRVLKLEDIRDTAGWSPEASSVKDGGAVDGAVRWREMIGMEIPEEEYQAFMREFHHDQPREMASAIYGGLEDTADQVRQQGGRIELGDGFQEIARHRRAPQQFE
jgi:hypothetical protein